jgi:hypothetical protein
MPENVTFYSQTYDALPDKEMKQLAGKAKLAVERNDEGGRAFVYRWKGLTVRCNEMPQAQVPNHLDGFCGYVKNIYRGKPDARGQQILDRIRHTRLVVGVVVDPKRDDAGRSEQLLGAMANGLDALIFYGTDLYDKDMKLILGLNGRFDKSANVLGPVADKIKSRMAIEMPEGESYQPTPDQQARYQRAAALLTARKVPMLGEPLYIDDDAVVTLRSATEVAQRALMLAAVTFRADGGSREQTVDQIERHDLWAEATPEEMDLLTAKIVEPELARKLLWRLEALWVLVWALGDLELNWPETMCDVPRLKSTLHKHATNPDFIPKATLRPKAEILDALQLTMLIHWAIRDAWVHDRNVPENLDWASPGEMVRVTQSAAGGVVAERHHALNWLIRFGDADWDDVDTPT